jgi:molybdate transport system substrate-binding protein
MVRPLFVLATMLAVLASGCYSTGASSSPATPSPGATASRRASSAEPLLVLAASDLQYAMEEVAAAYEAAGNRKPTLTFGSTGNFTAQIENGAPADLFFAADEGFIDRLLAKELILDDTRQLYATGRIVVTSARSAPLPAQTLQDLTRPELKVIAIANPEHAPYGRAAQQALQSSGVWPSVEPKLVLGENISETFQLIQTGNADAGIVALSIAMGVPDSSYALVDEALHLPLRQAVGVLKGSRQPDAARAFVAFVNGEQGRPIMRKYGFVLPGESS